MSTQTQSLLRIDETSVKITMDLLIHTNGKTTTKEVKDHLRSLNYFAEQKQVSQIMYDLFLNSDSYLCNDNGTFREYTFTAFRSTAVGFAEPKDDTTDTDTTDATDTPVDAQVIDLTKTSDIKKSNDSFRNSFMTDTNVPTSPVVVTTECKPVITFFNETFAKSYVTDDNSWVVRAANGLSDEIMIFDKLWNSDKVRSSYAKITGVKFTDTRARRFRNF